jgi:tetratricopeptide (TPR) repeat protein
LRLRAFLLGAVLCAAPCAVAHGQTATGDVDVSVERDGDQMLVTLRTALAPLDQVCLELVRALDCELEGMTESRRSVLVTAQLDRRPLAEVLEFVLGAAGLGYTLRTGVLTLVEDATPSLGRAELLELARTAYADALARYPAHERASRALLDQGEVEELRGDAEAALDDYQTLIARYPKVEEVPEAYLRAGRLLASLGRWADAAEQFRKLGAIDLASDYTAPARLELARCTVELGDPQSALYILAALEKSHPVSERAPPERRELVRALALVGTRRNVEGLRAVEAVESLLSGADRLEALRIRALALQGDGYPGDAARAWTLYASEVEEPARAFALEQAAKLALEVGDEVGVLFVVRQAETYGHGARFAAYKEEAYARLGFKTEVEPTTKSAAERVTAGEERAAAGDLEGASVLVRHLVAGGGALDPDLRTRLALVWSACLAETQGLEPAILYLHDVRASLADDAVAGLRAKVDVAAAALLEEAELFDRAADAYRGAY